MVGRSAITPHSGVIRGPSLRASALRRSTAQSGVHTGRPDGRKAGFTMPTVGEWVTVFIVSQRVAVSDVYKVIGGNCKRSE